MSGFFVVAVWWILIKYCHFKRIIDTVHPAGYVCYRRLTKTAFWHHFVWICPFKYFRESLIFAHFWWVHTRIFSLRPLALKCLHRQSLHEFSLNTDISVCCSGVTFARAPSGPGWWRIKRSYSSIERVNGSSTFPHRCCCNVLGSQNVLHQHKHALAKPCLFYELFINNIADAFVRFKLNRAVLARAEPCVENRTVRVFSVNRSTPNIYFNSFY